MCSFCVRFFYVSSCDHVLHVLDYALLCVEQRILKALKAMVIVCNHITSAVFLKRMLLLLENHFPIADSWLVQWWIVAEHLLVPLELYKVIFLVDFKRLTLLTQYFKQLPIYYTFLENNQTPSYTNLDSLSYCLSANMHKSPCLANQDGQCKEFLNLPEYLWIAFIQKIKKTVPFFPCACLPSSKPCVKCNIMWPSWCIMLHLDIHGPKSKLQLL
jgi:hypothetical protein